MSNDFKQRYEFSFRHTREEYELTPGQDVWPLLKTGVLTTLPEGYAGNKDVSNFFGLEST